MADEFWDLYAKAFAFLGNSLLKPMTQTETVGLDPEFWRAFPDFDDPAVSDAIQGCIDFVESIQDQDVIHDPVEQISVEYTKLFIGPPRPAAPPWETMNGFERVSVGFGEPTFSMQQVLRDMGLEITGENNQYADHLGIELLALSEMCRRVPLGEATSRQVADFIAAHPASWIGRLREKVVTVCPDGYFAAILALAQALLERLRSCSASS